MLGRANHNVSALTAVFLVALVAAAPAAASGHDCSGYDAKSRFYKLGGPAAFAKSVASPGQLADRLEAHRADVQAVMSAHGVGHLTDALIAAARTGNGLSERDLTRGEAFEWMAYRKRGPQTFGPACYAGRTTYSAYVIELTEEEMHGGEARCAIKADGQWVDEDLRVDAGGSSDGVRVTMSGPGGEKTIISTGTTWSGAVNAPGEYTFTATAQAPGTKTVTTHTFVIPKICLNIAYSGSTTEEMAAEPDTCTATAKVRVEERRPECTITVTPSEISRRSNVSVDVTGRWDPEGIRVAVTDPKGEEIAVLTEFPQTVELRRCGTYRFEGTATRSGMTEQCSATVNCTKPAVADGDWIFRAFGLSVATDGGEVFQSRIRPDGSSERSHTLLDGGTGLGVGLEYLFNERIGLEGSILYADLEGVFFFDIDDRWESDEQDVGMLAFLLGPNFHLTPASRVDFYIGPFVGLVDLDSASYRALGETTTLNYDDETVFGVQLGLDIPFGSAGWAFHLGGRFMDMSTEINDTGLELPVDPRIFELGLAYRF